MSKKLSPYARKERKIEALARQVDRLTTKVMVMQDNIGEVEANAKDGIVHLDKQVAENFILHKGSMLGRMARLESRNRWLVGAAITTLFGMLLLSFKL